jgi:hypothetical protein
LQKGTAMSKDKIHIIPALAGYKMVCVVCPPDCKPHSYELDIVAWRIEVGDGPQMEELLHIAGNRVLIGTTPIPASYDDQLHTNWLTYLIKTPNRKIHDSEGMFYTTVQDYMDDYTREKGPVRSQPIPQEVNDDAGFQERLVRQHGREGRRGDRLRSR